MHLSRAVEDGFGLADTKLKNIEVKFQSKIDAILNDLNNLKTRSDYGSERFIDVLLEENSKLKKENSVLSERVNDSLFLISDLKTHVKVIESEKQSLITCIKLLHNECNCHEDSSTNVKSPTTERPANDTEVSEQHNSPTNICKNATDQSVIILLTKIQILSYQTMKFKSLAKAYNANTSLSLKQKNKSYGTHKTMNVLLINLLIQLCLKAPKGTTNQNMSPLLQGIQLYKTYMAGVFLILKIMW